ncbi:hypothetical protein G8O24_15100 [Bradyrhizobium sp. INPA01-394B]|uniref:Type II toxin-antitoxin system VapB family antitoxin n=1 Tax=Bradyrhizobium campsiandrae TaxID=1729892 RepID=A0ABR7UIN4_9BRAD|nr:hypothetical protein [Bradyrhizobium campsiandrae]MBC9878667.1 hypothetical protein [Bradyrhizobium campsiandrae]MBC9983312.1 hypothetical protein [Bradyrhizobium campsiandrae]
MPRLQIDVAEQKLRAIELLMEECGFSTKKDLFNNALTLFQWAVNERKRGNTIAAIDNSSKNYRELHMPSLDDVRVVATMGGRAKSSGK